MNARKLRISLSLVLGLAGVLVLLWTMGSGPRVAQAQSVAHFSSSHAIAATAGITRYVSSVRGADTGDCAVLSAPCQTIQYAVYQANDGDEILIADQYIAVPGPPPATECYTGTGDNVIVLTKSLTLHGGYIYAHQTGPTEYHDWSRGPLPSVVDGEGERRVLYISGDVTPTLRMLSFTNGYADRGGNVYAEDANPQFIATPITSGTATYGGGLYLKNCRTSFDPGDLSFDLLGISGLLLVRNNTAQYGGGIYIEEGAPIMAGLAVYSNTAAADGGGFYLHSGQPIIAGGLVLENQAGSRGGGFFLGDSPVRIAGTAVYSNTAADGAGFYLDGPFAFSEETIPIIANNYVRYNRTTSSQGGGFYFRQAIAGLVNNVVADNQAADGAGLYLWASSPQLFHNTIAQNAGGSGIYVTHKPGRVWPPVVPIPSQPSFTNTIVVSHIVGIHADSTELPYPFENRVTLEGTLWWGNGSDTDGAGEIVQSTDVYSEPRFNCTGGLPGCVLPYHLEDDSAAVDAGKEVNISIPGTDLLMDIDLQLRPSGEGYDIGADEVVSETYSVWLIPPFSALATEPGQTVTHTHLLMNTGLETDTYGLEVLSSYSNWVTLLADTVITLSAQTSETVQLQVTVPDTATNDMRETSAITATSQQAPDRKGYALDVTSVVTGDQTDLAVGKWADTDNVEPGQAVRFTLVVTNGGPLTGTLVVTLTDVAVPADAIGAWGLPSNCISGTATGRVTCTLTLPEGALPVTAALNLVITTTDVYSGLLINMASVRSTARDLAPANNVAQTAVSVRVVRWIYLPLVLRGYSP